MFKLDVEELGRCINSSTDAYGREVVAHDAAQELSRQLHAAGAPDAPLEEQLRALLASHRAMQEAGEEMPSENDVAMLFEAWPIENRPSFEVTDRIYDLFRPLVARLTQERALVANKERLIATLSERNNVQNGRLAEGFFRLTEEQAARLKEGEEREAAEGTWHEATGCAGPNDARVEMARMRARIAELEASREPGADVVERLADEIGSAAAVDEFGVPRSACLRAARAVLSRLAAMGAEAWQGLTAADVQSVILGAKGRLADRDEVRAVLGVVRSRLSPVLGALRARVAELEGAARLVVTHHEAAKSRDMRALERGEAMRERGLAIDSLAALLPTVTP